ncbi:hypothetical protein IZ6_27740 [Terrihabitans soli]|uniref:TadE-like domain-containing protein n=1 Tax=Terrihabitans soli TaxID=708113 RepID=A0A6S6QSH5_9HYPH|nr:TadE/TadG family type IV pilus assembly protein [Terrihabitans soli]BCJ92039.1 hypothetical protein IZ6_27740 [Terrihabitans soli]
MRLLANVFKTLERFCADRSAVSAVEFALILPVLILMLLGSFDITRAVDAKNKSVLLSRTVTDLITQESDGVSKTELANIITASKFILYPYPDSTNVLTVNIENLVRVSETPLKYEIDWAYTSGTTPTSSSTNKQTTTLIEGESGVRTKVTYTYKMKFIGMLTKNIGLSEITLNSTITMAPRWGMAVGAAGW